MSDAITTSRATCGPVDQRRPVGSFRVENGIPVFDGPDADMLRLRRAAGLLRRIGAPGDCAAMYRARAFPDATAMFDLGCEWIAAQWIPEFDVLDEPWPWLRRSAVDPQRADGIDAGWIVRTLWDGYLSATDEDNGLVWVYDPVPGVMDMDADEAFDALHCKDLLRVKPFPVLRGGGHAAADPVQTDRFPRLATEDEHERDDDLGHDFRGHVLQHVQDEFVHARVYAS